MVVFAISTPSTPSTAQPSEEAAEEVELRPYTVRRGDSCGRIAHRLWGDWRRYDVILRYNPQLAEGAQRGACGPYLHPGVVLNLPVSIPGERPTRRARPDAELTAVQRQVRARQPAETEWQTAERGQDLYRGWRVNTLDEASAEVTFRDRAVVHLRENTLVVIYGAEAGQSRRRSGGATLERGTLRSRLGELRMGVRTPAGEAELRGGAAVVSVDEGQTARISNFDGGAATLRNDAGSVRVRPGFGSKVRPRRRPTPPRPLPPSPSWSEGPRRFLGLPGEGATLRGAWNPVDVARTYRVEVTRDGSVVAASEVPHNVRSFELHHFPAGDYDVRLSSIDSDFFESRPSDTETFSVLRSELRGPGIEASTELPDPSRERRVLRVLRGTVLVPPEGIRCTSDPETGGWSACSDESGAPVELPEIEVITPEVELVRREDGSMEVRVESALPLPTDAVLALRVGERTLALTDDAPPILELPEDLPAGEHEATLLVGDAEAADVSLVVQPRAAEVPDGPDPDPDPDPEPEPEPEPIRGPASGAFELSPHAELVHARDLRVRGHRLDLGFGRYGDRDGYNRFAAGGAVELNEHLTLGGHGFSDVGVDAAFDAAPRGDRALRLFVAARSDPDADVVVGGSLGGWVPLSKADGTLQTGSVWPTFELDLRVASFLRLATRQGARLDIERNGRFSWVSSYSLIVEPHWRVRLDVEVASVLGRDRGTGEDLNHLVPGASIGVRAGPLTLSVGGRYDVFDDGQTIGRLTLLAGLRVHVD